MVISHSRRRSGSVARAGAALLLAAASVPAHAEVYRCVRGDAVVYADKPCDAAGQPAKLPKALIVPAGPAPNLVKMVEERKAQERAAQAKADAAKAEQAEQAAQAQAGEVQRMETYASESAVTAAADRAPLPVTEVVVEGMSVVDVRRLHGEPTVVSKVDGAFPTRETWSYMLADGSRLHIAFVGGKVVSVQTRKEKK